MEETELTESQRLYQEIFDRASKYETRGMYGQLPVAWSSANKDEVKDQSGKKYIDFTSGIFVTNVGHANELVINRLINTLKKPLVYAYNYQTEIRSQYLKELVSFTDNQFEKTHLMSSGTEATEAALKILLINAKKNKKGKCILSISGNYHGRTVGAQMMGYGGIYSESYNELAKYFPKIKFPYPWELEGDDGEKFFFKELDKLSHSIDLQNDICGVMLETFQGWGALFYPKSFISSLDEFCKKNMIPLVFDEMQAGFYRTGKKFGFMHYDIKPDLICVGKGIGSGFPLSAILGSKDLLDLPEPGEMSSTNSANPIACTAGLGTLEVMKSDSFKEELYRNSTILKESLLELESKHAENLKYVSCKGMIGALIFENRDKKGVQRANKICLKALNEGLLLVRTGRESIKIGPPLNISKQNIKKGFSILNNAIEQSS